LIRAARLRIAGEIFKLFLPAKATSAIQRQKV
jgi:hypothetical protein